MQINLIKNSSEVFFSKKKVNSEIPPTAMSFQPQFGLLIVKLIRRFKLKLNSQRLMKKISLGVTWIEIIIYIESLFLIHVNLLQIINLFLSNIINRN